MPWKEYRRDRERVGSVGTRGQEIWRELSFWGLTRKGFGKWNRGIDWRGLEALVLVAGSTCAPRSFPYRLFICYSEFSVIPLPAE